MKIYVTVKTGAKEESVEKLASGEYRVCVKEPPKDGKANDAIIRAVADYFDVPVSRVKIKSGFQARIKMLEII